MLHKTLFEVVFMNKKILFVLMLLFSLTKTSLISATNSSYLSLGVGPSTGFGSITKKSTTPDFNVKLKKDILYGVEASLYVSLSQLIAIGIDGYLSWLKMNLPDKQIKVHPDREDSETYTQRAAEVDYFQCTDPNCALKQKSVMDTENNTDACNTRTLDKRFYYPKDEDIAKTYTYRAFGAMLGMKLYMRTKTCYLKFAVGSGQLSYRGLVEMQQTGQPAGSDHSYQRKLIKTKHGLAIQIALHTLIARSTWLKLSYTRQRNKSQNNLDTFTMQNYSLGLNIELKN